jgi:hypothetical protein
MAAMDSATAQTGGSALISREICGLRSNIDLSPVVCDLFPDGRLHANPQVKANPSTCRN